MVTEILGLSKLQVRNIFTQVLRRDCPDSAAEIDPRSRQFLFVADLLQRVKFLTAEQQMLLLGGLVGVGPELPNLVFADGRYCTWNGRTGWLCLETGDSVDQLPQPPLETIGYNLCELRRRCETKIKDRTGKNAEYHTGSMDEPRNVCDGAADTVS